MGLRAHLASNGDWEPAIVELPECREYPELQRRVFANAYFSKQKQKKKKKIKAAKSFYSEPYTYS